MLLAACGGGGGGVVAPPQPIVYAPHAVLDIPTVIDADGAPDIADPCVLKVGETWFLYATQSKLDLHVWTSDDLETWEDRGAVWTPTPGTWNEKGQAWAPHVEETPEGYFLYYTKNKRIGVARADTPLGPFEEVYDRPLVGGGFGGVGDGAAPLEGTPLENLDFDEFAIDAFLLAASNGERWLYFARYTPLSVLAALPMADYATPASDAPVDVLTPDVFGWEVFVDEGPWVIENGGKFHLMYSGNFADTVNYGVGVAVGDSPQGPFARYGTNPILRKNEAADFFGPGHHGVAPGAFGDLLMFYHTKVAIGRGFDRRIRYAPISFGEDGLLRLDAEQP